MTPTNTPHKSARDLSQAELDLINEIKAHAEKTREHLDVIQRFVQEIDIEQAVAAEPLRWLNIARTHFQQGYMALTRAVAQPTTF